jgi:hypothetical protein
MITEWHRPKLVLLVRSKSEESVLQVCKVGDPLAGYISPVQQAGGCMNQVLCGSCDSLSAS